MDKKKGTRNKEKRRVNTLGKIIGSSTILPHVETFINLLSGLEKPHSNRKMYFFLLFFFTGPQIYHRVG